MSMSMNMNKKIITSTLCGIATLATLSACGSNTSSSAPMTTYSATGNPSSVSISDFSPSATSVEHGSTVPTPQSSDDATTTGIEQPDYSHDPNLQQITQDKTNNVVFDIQKGYVKETQNKANTLLVHKPSGTITYIYSAYDFPQKMDSINATTMKNLCTRTQQNLTTGANKVLDSSVKPIFDASEPYQVGNKGWTMECETLDAKALKDSSTFSGLAGKAVDIDEFIAVKNDGKLQLSVVMKDSKNNPENEDGEAYGQDMAHQAASNFLGQAAWKE